MRIEPYFGDVPGVTDGVGVGVEGIAELVDAVIKVGYHRE